MFLYVCMFVFVFVCVYHTAIKNINMFQMA